MRDTLPDSKVVTTITEDAISDAVSPIRFRWRQRLTNRLTSFLRTVRPKRSFRSAGGHSDSDDIGVRSLPSVRINRYSTKNDTSRRTGAPQSNPSHSRTHPAQSSTKSSREPAPTSHSRSETHHRQIPSSSRSMTQRSVVDISSPPRSKSSDTRPQPSSSGSALHASKGLEKRRGSVSHLVAPDRPAASIHSNATTPDEPRPRSRFSLSSLRWRRGDPPPSTSASVSVTTSTPATPPMPSREPSGSTYQPGPELAPAASALVETDVAPAMRASSWGDVGEYGRLLRAHEAASMHSGAGEHDEPLDPDVVVVGAGGVANGPLPPTPSGSAGVLAALASLAPSYSDAMCHVPPIPPPLSPVVDALLSGRGNPHAARSIMQVSSYSSEGFGSGDGDGDGDGDPSDGDSDSFFARNSEEAARGAFQRHHLHPHAHLSPHPHPHAGCQDDDDDDDADADGGWGFGGVGATRRVERARAKGAVYSAGVGVEQEESDDDDDDEGSDEPPIEVRRRRPSWAVHHDEHEGDDEDEDDGPPPSPPSLREGDSGGDEP